ncbi:hypothetical protein TWF696_005099 [Orbilia brochopaga]|uniref:Uncharacterized protein n=1 Tax=Orbilia brochopaga TaxID=3140254 RepID=A0AAV9V2Y5_9PEZI
MWEEVQLTPPPPSTTTTGPDGGLLAAAAPSSAERRLSNPDATGPGRPAGQRRRQARTSECEASERRGRRSGG